MGVKRKEGFAIQLVVGRRKEGRKGGRKEGRKEGRKWLLRVSDRSIEDKLTGAGEEAFDLSLERVRI